MSNQKKKLHEFSKGRQFRILGIGKQDAIKYFFGGNAALAIIIIIGIVAYLVLNATTFFPDYRDSLTLYRKSGQEFVDYKREQYNTSFELQSLCTQIKEYEMEERFGALYRVSQIHGEFKGVALKKAKPERKEVERATKALQAVKKKKDSTPAAINAAEQHLAKTTQELKDKLTFIVNNLDYSDVKNKSWKTDKTYLQPIRNSIVENILTRKTTDFIKKIREEEAKKTEEISKQAFIQKIGEAKTAFNQPLPAYKKFIAELSAHTGKTKAQAEKFQKTPKTRQAIESGLQVVQNPEEKRQLELKLKRLYEIEPDYNTLNKPVYESLKTQKVHQEALIAAIKKGFAALPEKKSFESAESRERLAELRDIEKKVYTLIEHKRSQMKEWKHDKPYPMLEAVKGFFFGTRWITNSSWQDIYGILPLLSGSVAVAVLGIAVAIPFAVGGAIYVNRLSSPIEQKIIKPFIEFIEAIPSIVLGFFGLMVFSKFLVEYSQLPFVSWLPCLPVREQFTILNAGLLLALMSIPTIFTLCEDALNNVPKAYKEASLALGASKVQTVLSVILPSCASGIVAAVLLGFGRIIGETMVVLLVLGGTIAIPESFTDPAHSMTGILAQEIGEVDKGSLHWGALFMVGVILFFIALTLNYISQTILLKFTKNR